MRNLYDPGAQARDSSPDTTTVKTIVPPSGATSLILSVETNNARVTFDGSVPSATNGHIYGAGLNPVFLPFAEVVSFTSTIAGASIVNITWLY